MRHRLPSTKRASLYALSALLLFLLGFGVCYFIFSGKASVDESNVSFERTITPVNRLLAERGISNISEPKGFYCDDLDGDQPVRSACSTSQELQKLVDAQFMSDWQNNSTELAKQLHDMGWHKLPNRDPVTKNPVDTLPRLFEQKGLYPADVSYEKSMGRVRCDLAFYVEPADESTPKPLLRITEGCVSIIK